MGRPARLADLRQSRPWPAAACLSAPTTSPSAIRGTTPPAAGWSSASTRPPASSSGNWSSRRLETNDPNFNFDNIDLGICSSPTVDGDRVYLVTNRCEVVCLDVHGMANGNDGPFTDEGQYTAGPGKPPVPPGRDDADILWRFDMIDELPVWPQDAANCSVLVHGDFLYVCTSNGVDRSHDRLPYPLAPSLIVLDKRTGRLVAKDDEKIGTRMFHGQWSSPVAGRGRRPDAGLLRRRRRRLLRLRGARAGCRRTSCR